MLMDFIFEARLIQLHLAFGYSTPAKYFLSKHIPGFPTVFGHEIVLYKHILGSHTFIYGSRGALSMLSGVRLSDTNFFYINIFKDNAHSVSPQPVI